jgi:hypothetical protein
MAVRRDQGNRARASHVELSSGPFPTGNGDSTTGETAQSTVLQAFRNRGYVGTGAGHLLRAIHHTTEIPGYVAIIRSEVTTSRLHSKAVATMNLSHGSSCSCGKRAERDAMAPLTGTSCNPWQSRTSAYHSSGGSGSSRRLLRSSKAISKAVMADTCKAPACSRITLRARVLSRFPP